MTVVVLVKASSTYSLQQAQKLDQIRVRFSGNVEPKFRFIGINSRHWPSNMMINKFHSKVNFTIFQSTHGNDLWSRIGGTQDDVFIYDRCGLLAYYIPFPHSYVSHRFVEAAMMSAHFDSPCRCNDAVTSSSSTSSNCTNGTSGGPPAHDIRSAVDGEMYNARQIRTPSVQNEQVKTHTHSRHSSPTLTPECSRVACEICSNNTTRHQRSLTPLQQRCCHDIMRPAVPSSRCLCLSVEGAPHQDSCLCRPADDALNGPAAARKSCLCHFHKLTVDSSCKCEVKHLSDIQDCMCTFPRNHLSDHCA